MDELTQGREAAPATKTVRIVPGPHSDVELRYVNHMQANFNGSEFTVSFMQVVPPIYQDVQDLPDVIEARVVFRMVVGAEKWAEAVASFTEQIQKLQKDGLSPRSAGGG